MEFAGFLFLVSLFTCLGITALSVNNIVHKGSKLGLWPSIGIFVAFMLSWFFGLMVTMTSHSIIYSMLFKLNSLLFPLNIILLFASILFNLGNVVTGNKRERYVTERFKS